MTLNDMSNTLADKVAVHLNFPFKLEKDLQLHSITAQMMVQIVDMTDNAIMQEIISYAKENKICDVYLLDKSFVKNALEKQIPKKPLEVKLSSCYEMSEHNIKEAKCPSCGENVIGNQFGYYCGSCGQALDWSDT